MNKPTIYAVVRYIKAANLMEDHEVHIYTKQTSNKKVMLAYLKEQRERHKDIPNCKIGLMTRENAEEFRKSVAKVHADAVYEYINNLSCSKAQKLEIIEALQRGCERN